MAAVRKARAIYLSDLARTMHLAARIRVATEHLSTEITQRESMSFFQRPHYKSEATQFLDKLKADRPYLEAQQQEGRSLLWDKRVSPQVWADYRAGEVPQKPYVYQTNTEADKS